MATLAKPYTVTDAAQQSEDIDRMLDELYRAVQDLDEEPAQAGATGVAGAAGSRGIDGDEGEPGEPGQPGVIGAIGPIGLTGFPGRDGEDGEDGVMGASGSIGAVGASGAPGRDGEDADDSTWPTPIYVQASTNLTDSSSLARLSAIQSFTAANTWTATGNNFDELLAVDKGLSFPATQVSSAGANDLDDYEEGTWTPVIGGATSESGQTYAANGQVGRYVKVGTLVCCTYFASLTAKGTITGNVAVKGLPFTSENAVNLQNSPTLGYWGGMTTAVVHLGFLLTENATSALMYQATGAATVLTATVAGDLSNTADFRGEIFYRATA